MHRLKRQLCAAVTGHLTGDQVRPPEAGLLLWNAFGQMSRARTYGMAGPEAIRFTEIEAWARLMRVPLEPRHVEVLMAMDEAWLSAGAKTVSKGKAAGGNLTPGMFDAVFG